MDAAALMLKVLKEGGVAGALVIALCVIGFMWRENKQAFKDLLAEKDAHRQTSEKLSVMAAKSAELMERLLERRARAPRTTRRGGGPGPESGGGASTG